MTLKVKMMQTVASIVALLSAAIVLVTPVAADNPAIMVVVDSYTNLDELCYTFSSLHKATAYPLAPIFVFKGIALSQSEEGSLASCGSPRPVTFVDKTDFYTDIPASMYKERRNYDYQQTQRFLTTFVWDEPVLADYDVLMRVTDATCLTFTSDYLPGFPPNDPPLEFKSYTIPNDLEFTKYTVGLYDMTSEWSSANGVHPSFIALWMKIVMSYEQQNKIAKFSDDFQVISKAFMQRADVRAYHEHLTNTPQGQKEFYQRKWGWGAVMYLTVAIFGDPAKTSDIHVPGIVEKNMFAKNFFPNICRPTSTTE